jgi:hypothetical protein
VVDDNFIFIIIALLSPGKDDEDEDSTLHSSP